MVINIALTRSTTLRTVHSVTNCKAPKISLWSNGRELNGFIIDLIYYAFSGVQSGVEAVSENRYRLPNMEVSVK